MIRTAFVGAMIALTPIASRAADLAVDYAPVAGHCDAQAASVIASQDLAVLRNEVVSRMDQAIATADDPRWISSTRPVFVWASETKVACGMAYGYLQSGWRDETTTERCYCFYAKMVDFMN